MAKAAHPALFEADELQATPPKMVTDAQATWNEFADKNKWQRCEVLDKARRASIARAVADYGGLIGWRKGLETVEKSRFVMGKVPPKPNSGFRQFKASIDWFCQAKTIRQVFEGFWEDDGGQEVRPSISSAMAPADQWASALRSYKLKGFWNPSLGPRPEDPACRAPAAMLEACRKRLGIEVKARPVETEEERLAASIVSLRKYGQWDRANKAEERLARLQGRPPVLVPAPEVAHMGMPERPPPAGSGRPRRGPLSEVDEHGRTSPADAERERRMAHHALSEPPEYDGVPEGEQYEDAEA